MMKRLIAILIILVFTGAYTRVDAGAKRVVNVASGTTTINLPEGGADTVATGTGMNKALITNSTNTNIGGKKFDKLYGSYLISAWTDVGDSIAGENGVDTCIITTYTGTEWIEVIVSCDTCTSLPCTLTVYYYEDIPFDGTLDNDTAADARYRPGSYEKNALLHEHLWFDYDTEDTAGDLGHLRQTIQYWFRGVEDE